MKDTNYKLTTTKYKQYLHDAKHAKTLAQVRDVLYTFIGYFRHLGDNSTDTARSGKDFVYIVSSFQEVMGKYHLRKSLSKLSSKQLRDALKPSLRVMALWYYTITNRTKKISISVKHIRKKKEAINKINTMIYHVQNVKDLCLGMSVNKYGVSLLIVPHNKIIK